MNLIGQTFNFLTVIDGPELRQEGKKKRYYWKCQCKCGKIVYVRGDRLKSGNTKSCGYYKLSLLAENNKKRQTLDLTGKRFGKLVAVEPTEKRTPDKRVIWRCKCDCGNECEVSTHNLQSGKTLSCGCLKSKGELSIERLLQEHNIPFETQKKFDSCRFKDTGYLAIFDFFVNSQYIIEYDGEQHFYYDAAKHSWNNNKEEFEKRQKRDQFKNSWCKENHIPIIRIPYTRLENLTIEDLLLDTSIFVIPE